MELKQSMNDMITRCPKCHTSFRITPAQLQTAKGAVRCGSCLHIFKAMEHLVPGKNAPQPVAAKSAVSPAPSARTPVTERKFRTDNETVVRPLSTNPKFEYHKPKSSNVSAKDIADALRSSLDNPLSESPTPKPKPKTKTQPNSNNAAFGIPDDILDEDEHRPLRDDEGQQNMLVFDQAAIDSDDLSDSRMDEDDLLISDDMALAGEEKPAAPNSAYGDDLVESFLDLDNWKPKESSLFDRKSKTPKEEEDSDDKHSPDESWAIELLEDDDDAEPTYSGVHASLDELDLEMDEPDYEPPAEEYSRATTGSFNALDDSDIEDALGEPLSEHIEPKFDSSEPVTEKEFYPAFDYDSE